MSTLFHPGQNVVCINGKPIPECNNQFLDRLCEGHVYTVRDIVDYSICEIGLRLEEIVLPRNPLSGREWTFAARRFKPCKPTSIDVFTRICAKIQESV